MYYSTPPHACDPGFMRDTRTLPGIDVHGLLVLRSLCVCNIQTHKHTQSHTTTLTHKQRTLITSLCHHSFKYFPPPSPAIAQLVEDLTVDLCSNQMVPGSIPGGRIFGMRDTNDLVRTMNTHTYTHTMMMADDRKCLCFVSLVCLCVY